MIRKKLKTISLEKYRYQLLPLSKHIQLSFDNDITTYEELVKNKNNILAKIITNENLFIEYANSQLSLKFEGQKDNIYIFRINIQRNIKINTLDFREKQIENFPAVFIAFNNDNKKQIIAIEKNYKAFAKPETVSHILESNLNRFLKPSNLAIYIEPIYSKEDFWNAIDNYENRIKQVEFELIRPNMSNISSTISEQLKDLENSVDAHKLGLTLTSGNDGTLIINRENKQISGLVEYSSKGGGNISIKIKGLSKKIKTSKTPIEINISELELKNLPSDQLINLIRNLI